MKGSKPVTSEAEALKLFPKARRTFWQAVRRNPEARKFFEDRGFVFRGKSGAPLIDGYQQFPRRFWDEFRVSLDHTAPKATGGNWIYSLDGALLEFVTHADNTMLQILETRHPSLKRP
jgi:hypothetical protein